MMMMMMSLLSWRQYAAASSLPAADDEHDSGPLPAGRAYALISGAAYLGRTT